MDGPNLPKDGKRRPLKKQWFMSLPNGYYVLMNVDPLDYIELQDDREQQWRQFSPMNAGRLAHIYSSKAKCLEARQRLENLRDISISMRRNLVEPEKIARAYRETDPSSPRDPALAVTFEPGMYSEKLTKRLLMSLPTGTLIKSNTMVNETKMPLMSAVVPPVAKREGFWLEVRTRGLNGRTFQIIVGIPLDDN